MFVLDTSMIYNAERKTVLILKFLTLQCRSISMVLEKWCFHLTQEGLENYLYLTNFDEVGIQWLYP